MRIVADVHLREFREEGHMYSASFSLGSSAPGISSAACWVSLHRFFSSCCRLLIPCYSFYLSTSVFVSVSFRCPVSCPPALVSLLHQVANPYAR